MNNFATDAIEDIRSVLGMENEHACQTSINDSPVLMDNRGKIMHEEDFLRSQHHQAVLRVEGQYIQMTERYVVRINHESDPMKIASIALECISKLRGEKLFYQQNISKLKQYCESRGIDVSRDQERSKSKV